ncbi:MAG: hypothetical protein ACTSR2_01845 [Candidatus Hodarchaeales archaeon]
MKLVNKILKFLFAILPKIVLVLFAISFLTEILAKDWLTAGWIATTFIVYLTLLSSEKARERTERKLDYAIKIIRSYQLDIKEAGLDKKGFCQGKIYKNAIKDIVNTK